MVVIVMITIIVVPIVLFLAYGETTGQKDAVDGNIRDRWVASPQANSPEEAPSSR